MTDLQPDHLDTTYDWMSVPHAALHRMVNDRLNPDVGQSVSAGWAALADKLSRVGEDLTRLADATEDAWHGRTAELASGGITALARWARDAGDTAADVAGCVARQADNAARAREAMPPPVQGAGAASTFASGGFASAPHLLVDQRAEADGRHSQHAQAARVMEQFQAASREVHRSVPRFAPPDRTRQPRTPRDERPTATTAAAATTTTTTSATSATSGPGGAVPQTEVRSPGTAHPGRPGGLAGAVPGRPAGGGFAEYAPGRTAPTAQTGFGAMPMGALGNGRDEDRERRCRFAHDEPGLFGEDLGGDLMVSAAVIGELPHA